MRAGLGLPSCADSIEHPLVRRLSVLLLLACVAGPLGGCGRVGHEGVRASIEQLASISAEGALMAGDLARGRTKTRSCESTVPS